jgi:hypothetical protein
VKESSEKGKMAHKAKFIKESFAEKFAVDAGSKFLKIWTFKNVG